MNPTVDAFLRSWPLEPWTFLLVSATAAVYLRGWLILHQRDPERWHGGPLAAFLGGLVALYLALASPIEPFAALLLQVHMVQHLLLMMAVPPLLWLGAPLLPMLRGLPGAIRQVWVAPLFRRRWLRWVIDQLTQPAPALAIFAAATWVWHVPAVYDLALRWPAWHYLQHACFLGAGLLFWYPVVMPYPGRPRSSRWGMVPYLILADVQNTALAALLTFADYPLYRYYTEVPPLAGITPESDQATAGVLMWVPGSLVFLVPLCWIVLRLLQGEQRPASTRAPLGGRLALPLVQRQAAGFDLLRLPAVGTFLRWRHARVALQVPLFLVAALIIYDGLYGPPIGSMNLAGVLPWIHWRGLVALGLLAAGNVFCMGCPFMLPRTVARRWLPAQVPWPRWLRSKWLAVALIAVFLWAYEAFALWDSPWWTAWIAIGYFLLALAIDGIFRGASFCKYVCPLGQFNFIQSLISPLSVAVRQPAVCQSCTGKECIRGSGKIPGCELHLFQPRKSSNMDCTFCLDCVHACPHDNVGMPAGLPAAELWRDPQRSGIGRLGRRSDVAALVLVLVFGAFANAAAMVAPVAQWLDNLGAVTGYFLLALLGLPLLLVMAATLLSRRLGRLSLPVWQVATRFSYSLVPLGFAMWLTHYCFHLVMSYDAVVPTTQRFLVDLSWPVLGEPAWACCCSAPVAGWLLRLEIFTLDVGLLLSLYTGYRIAHSQHASLPRQLGMVLPWALLAGVLFGVGVWLVFQPMQMRGLGIS